MLGLQRSICAGGKNERDRWLISGAHLHSLAKQSDHRIKASCAEAVLISENYEICFMVNAEALVLGFIT
jgi:hypothetical protein